MAYEVLVRTSKGWRVVELKRYRYDAYLLADKLRKQGHEIRVQCIYARNRIHALA